LKVQQFLNKSRIETPEDLILQNQLFAYIVAKHYSISLTEVYQMEDDVFTQSIAWALAVQEEEEKELRRQQMQDETSNETVSVDYTFLETEDF
tara:strand:- start:1307 stop:1585 length:279 start_codon:yes stop_codon:yes gene_type:complete